MKGEMSILLLNMSLTGGIVILAVLLLRLVLRRAPKAISYGLWAVVLFRLMCPVSFSLPVSLVGMAGGAAAEQGIVFYISEDMAQKGTVPAELAGQSGNTLQTPQETGNPGEQNPAAQLLGVQNSAMQSPEMQNSKAGNGKSADGFGDAWERLLPLAGPVWAAGACGLFLYGVISLLLFRRKLRGAEHTGSIGRGMLSPIPIYEKEGLPTSFVMGIFRPGIYLPRGLTGEQKRYILMHEQVHIKRLDYVIKPVSFFALCIHWFNPLVWAAYFLSGSDMEMSCDEAVIRKLGDGIKRGYSDSLLSLAVGKHVVGAAPLAFGEGDTGKRIKNVLKYKKPGIAAVCAALVLAAAAGVFLLANPAKETAGAEAFGENAIVSGGEQQSLEQQAAEEKLQRLAELLEQEKQGLAQEDLQIPEETQEELRRLEEALQKEVQQLNAQQENRRMPEETQEEVQQLEKDLQKLSEVLEEEKKKLSGEETQLSEDALQELQRLDAQKQREAMRNINWGEAFTWKRLKKLAEEKNTNLQDYAGYDGAEWDDMEDSNALNRYLTYRLTDGNTGEEYRVMVSYRQEDNDENQIDMLYLIRESDQSILSLYQGEAYGWQEADIDAFIGYIPQLSDWIAEYRFPGEENLASDAFSSMVGHYGGQTFQWAGASGGIAPHGDGVMPEWSAAASIARMDGEGFVFVNGALEDVVMLYNHAERVDETETVSGCEEQTVLFRMNCDMFTAAEIGAAEEAGNPIPESGWTADIWYVCIGREGSPWGYAATLNGRYFSREDAVDFARSLKFTEQAW